MTVNLGRMAAGLLTVLAMVATPVWAAPKIVEPKKIKAPSALKDGEGAVQLSVRTQKQFIETAIIYFVALDAEGRDTDRVYRFERGAGVPIMGSNMIDEKQAVYRMPAGRYRPLAFTVACDQMPYTEGLVCGSRGFSPGGFPTGYYREGEATFEVRPGHLTRAGDYIVEYVGQVADPKLSLFEYEQSPSEWDMRWRPARGEAIGFEQLPAVAVTVPEAMHSRITCDARPAGVTLFIPFAC